MNIYFEVEVFNREFQSRLFLASYSVLENFDVYMMHRNEIIELGLSGNISPGIVFMKDANSTNFIYKTLFQMKKKGFIFTSQDEEAGIVFENYSDFVKRRFVDGKTLKLLEYYFNWGQRDQKKLKETFKNKTNFVNTGSPRIDLLDRKLYQKNKSRFLKKFDLKKYILIPTNISFPIGLRRIADSYFGFMSDSNNINFVWKEDYFFEKNLQQLALLKHFIRMIRFLIQNQKKYSIVLRPHPNEKVEDWEKLIGIKNRNFKIIKDGYLSEFITNSECIVQNGCTSSIEAKILNKKVISFEPIKFKLDYDKGLMNKLGKICKTNKEVLNGINSKKAIETNLKNLNQLKYRLRFGEKEMACSIIVDIFCSLRNKYKFKEKYFKTSGKKYSSSIKKIIKSKLYKLAKIKKTKTIFEEKFPILNNEMINDELKKFIKFDKKLNKTKFKIISDRILKVYVEK